MARRIVVMQNPGVFDVWTHSDNPFSQSFEHIAVEGSIDGLSRWYELFVNDPSAVEEGNQHGFHFGLAHSRLLWSWRPRRQPLLALSFCFQVILKEPTLITSNDSIENGRIIFYLLQTVFRDVHSMGFLLV